MTLDDLKTPALILDRTVLARNCAMMTAAVARHGVRLRPHMKTGKSIDVARMALDGNFGGITVSTLAEADYFLGHGIGDITYAVGIVPVKLAECAALIGRGADLRIVTDDLGVARAIGERGAAEGVRFATLIEVDVGEHRGGLAPDDDALVAIGKALHDSGGAALAGVLAHAGHSYDTRDADQAAACAETERAGAVLAAERLRAAGLPCGTVSIGSTPTALHARNLDGVTEARPGVYMFGDLFQRAIGSVPQDGMALSVLASVIGHRRKHGRLLLDAGALALSKDRSMDAIDPSVGFGLVHDRLGRAPYPGLAVEKANQEHGIVTATHGAGGDMPWDALPPGATVRVYPNHACLTAAAYDRYHVVEDGGDTVVAVWERVNGW